jgi:hypothetical protein
VSAISYGDRIRRARADAAMYTEKRAGDRSFLTVG